MRMKHVIKFLEIIYVLNMDLMFTSGRRIISPQNDFWRDWERKYEDFPL